MNQQGNLSLGIYEFEDLSGSIIATKIPYANSADLYDGTRVIVRPSQVAIIVYNGKITDIFGPGSHEVHTGNFPILTKLANWKFGFESPLRCEIRFFSLQMFRGCRWGTASPVIVSFPTLGSVPLRAFGNYNFQVFDPQSFFLKLMGTKPTFDVTDFDEFMQGQILELLPKAIDGIVCEVKDLSVKQDEVSKKLEILLNEKLKSYGVIAKEIQVASLLPPKEIVGALEQKIAMDVIGDKKEFLLYKIANSLEHIGQGHSTGSDQSQILMSLMLSKGLIGGEPPAQEAPKVVTAQKVCEKCKAIVGVGDSFCGKCGGKL